MEPFGGLEELVSRGHLEAEFSRIRALPQKAARFAYNACTWPDARCRFKLRT
jgi:hypothetical protein